MKKYRVISMSGISIGPGSLLELTEDQAAARAYALREGDAKGVYSVARAPGVQFKYGETFGLDGDLPKHLVAEVEESAAEPGARKRAKPEKGADGEVAL